MELLTAKQKEVVDGVMREAVATASPDWYSYSIFKQRLERDGIYSTDVLRQLSDALGL